MIRIFHDENLRWLQNQLDQSYNLIYVDPPFNTGKTQKRHRISVKEDQSGDRIGFGNKLYKSTIVTSGGSYQDNFEHDEFYCFLENRLRHAHRLLKTDGSLFVHLDYREVHYIKILLDHIFGRESFMNEIIWSYDYGGKPKDRWAAKHDTILWYAKNPKNYCFNYDAIERIPYMAPSLVGDEKAERGKVPTDVWWNTIVPTNGREKTGYPTQKPLGIINRIVAVHSNPGDMLLDFFAGSGTLGVAANNLQRNCDLVDDNEEAIVIMEKRLELARETGE